MEYSHKASEKIRLVQLVERCKNNHTLKKMGNAFFYSTVLTVYLPRKYWLI